MHVWMEIIGSAVLIKRYLKVVCTRPNGKVNDDDDDEGAISS